ncbi:hypothetical protein [Streptomyces tsukubensis]|uniref:hypothetical protein n=1 Tax=Streptomyces tsukubensis TaxID=83656 RepID=UPI001872E169
MGEDRLARAARAEWGPLSRAVRAGSAARGWRGAAMTLFAVCLTAFFHFAQNRTWGGFVRVLGEVRAEDPLWLSLLRTPLSVCVPAADLPVWGALAQLLLVGAVAELSMGRWRTLLIAYASTLVGTLYARRASPSDPVPRWGPRRTRWSSTRALRPPWWGWPSSSACGGVPGSQRSR